MVEELTAKTEVITAVAVNGRDYAIKVFLLDATFNGIDAVGSGTPFQVVLVVDICAC